MSKSKSESFPQINSSSVLAGALIGTAAALFLTTKHGRLLKEELRQLYCEAGERVQELSHQLVEKSEQVSEYLHPRKRRPEGNLNVIIGGVAGGVIGISTALALGRARNGLRKNLKHIVKCVTKKTQEFGEEAMEHAQEFTEDFGSQLGKWVNIAQKLIEAIHEHAHEYTKNNSKPRSRAVDFLDWTANGIRLFQKLIH